MKREFCFPVATAGSRLSAAGTSDVFVAQMMGHSTPGILQTYAKAVDEFRRDAIRKLESFRESQRKERLDFAQSRAYEVN